jgi:hypothetical protein
MSFDPEMIAAEIKKHIPDFRLEYKVDPIKQAIANSGQTPWIKAPPRKNGLEAGI